MICMSAVITKAAGAPARGAFVPAYVQRAESGELARRVAAAWRHLEDCDLCARYCHVNRRAGVEGAVCRTGERAVVASWGAHHGEEDVLRGWGGSGTIFFGWCNLRCVFCQNWDLSQKGAGREVEPAAIADMMLALQAAALAPVLLDPVDCFVAATALAHGATLLTADTRVIEARAVDVLDARR